MPPSYSQKNGRTKEGAQKYIPDAKKYLYNIDTLWLNVGADLYDEVMDYYLRDILIEGRSNIQDDGELETVVEVQLEDYENPIIFEVFPGNPPLYQYSLRNDSMAIYFAKNQRDNGQLPMRIEFNQFLLWEKGVEGAFFEGVQVLQQLGFLPNEYRLNRVDFAVHSDQFQWSLSDMQTFEYPRNIANDNEPNFYKLNPMTGIFETMMVGDRSRLAIRIYNKSKEIEKKKKYYFYELYNKHNMDPDKVWNIEIEVRRPYLKDLCLEDDTLTNLFDDFILCLAEDGLSRLWSMLMKKYSHKSSHWNMLKKFDRHFKFQQVHGLTIHKENNSNFEKEIPQILGRLSHAVLNEHDYSLEHAVKILFDKIPEYEAKQEKRGKKIVTFEQRVKNKKSKIQNEEINTTIMQTSKRVVESDNKVRSLDEIMKVFGENNEGVIKEKQEELTPTMIKARLRIELREEEQKNLNQSGKLNQTFS